MNSDPHPKASGQVRLIPPFFRHYDVSNVSG
jgi:hypothetical protein